MCLEQSALKLTTNRNLHDSLELEEFSSAFFMGFIPAFQNEMNGEVCCCHSTDGSLAHSHSLDSVPFAWVAERSQDGRPIALIPGIRPGYLRGNQFWNLSDFYRLTLDS